MLIRIYHDNITGMQGSLFYPVKHQLIWEWHLGASFIVDIAQC